MAPKKGKANRVPETEEERAVRLEAEALAAREGARRREEAARLRLRERQMREQAHAHVNSIKIHNQWRRIMRMAKTEELREEIEILAQSHEREVDRKDAVIQMLDRDLEDAEEQYGTALRGHLQIIDSLLDLQYARMRGLRQQFDAQLKALEDEFDSEKSELAGAHNRQKKDMTDMMTAMETQFTDAENEARQEFESAREEIRNRSSEEYNVLKISLEGQIEELERTFESAHQAYLANTEARSNAFKSLTKSDASAARVIEQRMRKLVHMQEQLAHWRTKIVSNGREWEQRNKTLRAEKDIMARHYATLKAAMEAFRSQQNARLKQLSVASSDAERLLKQKLGSAERILKVAELCRKLETEQEKVLPFWTPGDMPGMTSDSDSLAGSSSGRTRGRQGHSEDTASFQQAAEHADSDEEAAHTSRDVQADEEDSPSAHGSGARQAHSPVDGPDEDGGHRKDIQGANLSFLNASSHALDHREQPVGEWDYLNNFFKRSNKVLLDKAAVDKERARLATENADLRHILRQYLDGIAVNADVMNSPTNPLLVVNQRLQLTLAERNKAYQARQEDQEAMQVVAGAVLPQEPAVAEAL